MLNTSKGKVGGSPSRTIYEHHPAFDLRCHSLRSRLVLAEDHCRKAKRRIVCNPYRLCLVADSEHQENRAEEFLLIGGVFCGGVSPYPRAEIKNRLPQPLSPPHPGVTHLSPALHFIPHHI